MTHATTVRLNVKLLMMLGTLSPTKASYVPFTFLGENKYRDFNNAVWQGVV